MKNILFICFYLLLLQGIQAQVTINRTINRSYKDKWSKNYYSDINKETAKRLGHTTANIFFVKQLNDVISHQHDELKDFATAFSSYKNSLTRFVKGSSFNSTVGFNSYGYIQKKYPVLNPLNPSDVFRNTIIRNRFFKKLKKESDFIDGYLNKGNPIPEGERMLLVLIALENVIKITLEDETY